MDMHDTGRDSGKAAAAINGGLSLLAVSLGHSNPCPGWAVQPPCGASGAAGTQQWACRVGSTCRDPTSGCKDTFWGASSMVSVSVGFWEQQGGQTKLRQPHLLQEKRAPRGAPAAGEGVMVTSMAGSVHKWCESCEHVTVWLCVCIVKIIGISYRRVFRVVEEFAYSL